MIEPPMHRVTFPRVGTVRMVDQAECLRIAREYLEAAISECAIGDIEADWIDGAIDNIELAIPRIEERIAEHEDRACTCRPRAVRPTDIEPPPVVRDRDCPIHGIDPDAARDKMLDDRRDA